MTDNKLIIAGFYVLLILGLIAVGATSFIARQEQDIRNYASELDLNRTSYSSKEVIVKFKDTPTVDFKRIDLKSELSKNTSGTSRILQSLKIRQVANSPVPESILQINQKHTVKTVEAVVPDDPKVPNAPGSDKIFKITFEKDVPVKRVLSELATNRELDYVEPNIEMKILVAPNDPDYYRQWGLNNLLTTDSTTDADIDAPEAWDRTTTDTKTVIVAVIDTGVEVVHDDLKANIWFNPGEVAFNGQDDDNNGYVDDYQGWNFLDNNNNPYDDLGHGTHIAGVIGAVRNNGRGVAGVGVHVKIMALKFMGANGSGYMDDAARAIYYAVDNGAQVINASFGAYANVAPRTLQDAIVYAKNHGVIIVTAAGNDGYNIDEPGNEIYPGSYMLDNIITVAATNTYDALAPFSNYGQTDVDIAAPGTTIASTFLNNQYGYLSGTSMAAPFVSGAVATAFSHFPQIGYREIVTLVGETTDRLPALQGKTRTAGRLNMDHLLARATTEPLPSPTGTSQPTQQVTPTATRMPTASPTKSPTPTHTQSPNPTVQATTTPTPRATVTTNPTTPTIRPPTATHTPSPNPGNGNACAMRVAGDANCTNNVDTADFTCWKLSYAGSDPGADCISADFNADSQINLIDYAIWAATYGARNQ